MKKRRRPPYQRRARAQEKIEDGQDSFLDVVSNLVGILIILVMIAGARVHNAASESLARADENAQTAERAEDAQTRAERQKYVDAVDALTKARRKLEETRQEAEEFNERYVAVELQADVAEYEYRTLLAASAQIEAKLKAEAQRREDSEQIAYELKSEIFEKEKKRDDLLKEKDALKAARPRATTLENIPTPISQRVEEGRECFFQLKNGRLAYVPINECSERLRLHLKNFRGDLAQKTFDEKIGPVDNFDFHYILDVATSRDHEGTSYYVELRYGEFTPLNDRIGEPVDAALDGKNSEFSRKLLRHDPRETTVTVFVYPDSFQYLHDIKKRLFSLKYQMALRPLPDGVPIAISPHGTSSASY
ncbi:MAG: hypothetical protein IIY32_00140 [Thermoguttaceae bacterium]|nr:hypothetical protein [Thermoguttaceae bacterium]